MDELDKKFFEGVDNKDIGHATERYFSHLVASVKVVDAAPETGYFADVQDQHTKQRVIVVSDGDPLVRGNHLYLAAREIMRIKQEQNS